jgi:hypothetical protein
MMTRTDGALVRLVTGINPDEPEENADNRLQSFMAAALPRLADFLPARTSTKSANLSTLAGHS